MSGSAIKHSTEFNTRYLGFQAVLEFEPCLALTNSAALLGLTLPDLAGVIPNDVSNWWQLQSPAFFSSATSRLQLDPSK
jgi:hypothetical protein